MRQLSFAVSNLPGKLTQKLEATARAGFTHVDLCADDLAADDMSIGDVQHILQQQRLSINTLSLLNNTTSFDEYIGQAHSLGADTVLMNVQQFSDQRSWRNIAEKAQTLGLKIALIDLPQMGGNTDITARELVRKMDHPALGLALNSVFEVSNGKQASHLRDIHPHHIFHVQVNDVFETISSPQTFLFPTQGNLNLESFVRVISRTGYAGAWSVGHYCDLKNAQALTYVRDGFRALVSLLADVAMGEVNTKSPLPDLPQKIRAKGVEFIEFAVDGFEKAELTSLLSTLSFRKERIHKNKSVELWRQGAINIVINSNDQGAAAKARKLQGPCVCAIGLRVEDAQKTVQRAEMLGAHMFSQPLSSGELSIPAIKGVGRSIVHFIDEKTNLHRVWDIEFEPVKQKTSLPPSGLRRIDHVAQTMPYAEMQSWLTYYLSTFDMEKTDIIDVSDPAGVVLSQALSTPEGEVRLNLNGASNEQTFAGAFLSNGFGAGVQHLAFSSDDIFETSNSLSSACFTRLSIGPSYYEVLKDKFNLKTEFIKQLRQHNILYDQDNFGEYFQIYGQAIWNGFFIEIVQRAGSYKGFGAANAPARLAAQLKGEQA